MEFANSFRELEVYKLARQLAKDIFEASKTFPKEEVYSLTSQIRRASRSIGGQIAEAWGKRRYVNHFISKLTDGDGEQNETQHWSETALYCNYISAETRTDWINRCESISRMLNKMIEKADSFCSSYQQSGK